MLRVPCPLACTRGQWVVYIMIILPYLYHLIALFHKRVTQLKQNVMLLERFKIKIHCDFVLSKRRYATSRQRRQSNVRLKIAVAVSTTVAPEAVLR